MATCRECMSYELCQENLLIEIADLYDIDFEDIDEYLDTSKWSIDKREVCKHFKNKSDYVKRERGEWINNSNGTFICSVCGGSASKMNCCGHCRADKRS